MSDQIRCPFESDDCGGLVMQRRCNTRFVDDASNLLTSCRHCYESAWRDRNGDWDAVPGGSPFPDEPPSDAEIIADRDNERLRAQVATLTAEVERKQAALEELIAAVGVWQDIDRLNAAIAAARRAVLPVGGEG